MTPNRLQDQIKCKTIPKLVAFLSYQQWSNTSCLLPTSHRLRTLRTKNIFDIFLFAPTGNFTLQEQSNTPNRSRFCDSDGRHHNWRRNWRYHVLILFICVKQSHAYLHWAKANVKSTRPSDGFTDISVRCSHWMVVKVKENVHFRRCE